MKITKIETILVSTRHLFLKVYTDEGIVGYGESGLWGSREGVVGTIRRLTPVLIGQNPENISYINEKLYTKHQFKGMNIMSAIGAIDLALWDIRGKSLGVPVYKLLGGKYRDRIRFWTAIRGKNVEEIRDNAERVRDEDGYDAVRINPCMGTEHMTTVQRLHEIYRRVEAVREVFGDSADIGIEIHRELNPDDTIRVCNKLEQLDIMFYEDPCRSENLNTMKYVSSKTTVPLAAGERCISIQEFEQLFENGMRLARPDLATLGGLTAGMKIAAIAEAHHAGLMPHQATSAVVLAANIQYCATIPNFTILETFHKEHLNTILDCFTEETRPQFDKNYFKVPDIPGLGVELIPDVAERYPYDTSPWEL